MKVLIPLVFMACVSAACNPTGDNPDPITGEHAATAGEETYATARNTEAYFELSLLLDAATCVTLSGDTTDLDLDLIPANVTATLDCVTIDGNVQTEITGTIDIQDTTPALLAFDYDASYSLAAEVSDSSGVRSTGTLDTEVSAVASGNVLQLTISGSTSTTFTYPDGTQGSIANVQALQSEFTPAGVWVPGLPLDSGSVALSGSLSLDIESQASVSHTLSQSTALEVESSCDPGRYTSGDVSSSFDFDGGSHDLALSWTGCDAVEMTLDSDAFNRLDVLLPIYLF